MMLCLVLGLLNRSCGKWRGDLLPYLCLQVWCNRVRIIFWLKLNLIELQYYLSEAFCFVARRYSWFALHKFIFFIFLLSYLDSSLSPLGSYFLLPYSFHQTKPWRFIDGSPFLPSSLRLLIMYPNKETCYEILFHFFFLLKILVLWKLN